MGTVDLTTATGGTASWDGISKHFVQHIHVDFSATTMTAGDIYQVWTIPAGTLIRSCRLVNQAAGSTYAGTYDVGITGVNADDLGDGVAYETAATTFTYVAEAALTNFLPAAADTVDVLIKTVTGAGYGSIFDLYLECVSLT